MKSLSPAGTSAFSAYALAALVRTLTAKGILSDVETAEMMQSAVDAIEKDGRSAAREGAILVRELASEFPVKSTD